MYIYALRLLSTNKIIAKDWQPELLNYLQLGLPDCNLEVFDDQDDIEVEYYDELSLIPRKLQMLKTLTLKMEQILATSRLQPTFINTRVPLCMRESLEKFAQNNKIDLDLYIKTRNLILSQQIETQDRCWILFEKYARLISQAESSTELSQIGSDVHRCILTSSST